MLHTLVQPVINTIFFPDVGRPASREEVEREEVLITVEPCIGQFMGALVGGTRRQYRGAKGIKMKKGAESDRGSHTEHKERWKLTKNFLACRV